MKYLGCVDRNPLIAQLVEQWTVVFVVIHWSLVQVRLKGFYFLLYILFLQVSSQTGEDSTGRDTQTDDVVMVNRWVQWPPEDLRGWGCDDGDNSNDTTGDNTNILLSEKESIGLSKFLQSASQVNNIGVGIPYNNNLWLHYHNALQYSAHFPSLC